MIGTKTREERRAELNLLGVCDELIEIYSAAVARKTGSIEHPTVGLGCSDIAELILDLEYPESGA